jgi:hypothetical protein
MYIGNSDKSKYRSLTSGLQKQQTLGKNQYPKTIAEANNVLSSHSFDYVGKKYLKTQIDQKKMKVIQKMKKRQRCLLQ